MIIWYAFFIVMYYFYDSGHNYRHAFFTFGQNIQNAVVQYTPKVVQIADVISIIGENNIIQILQPHLAGTNTTIQLTQSYEATLKAVDQ